MPLIPHYEQAEALAIEDDSRLKLIQGLPDSCGFGDMK